MSYTAQRAIGWTEQGLVPDVVIRGAIRWLLKKRLEDIHAYELETHAMQTAAFGAHMDRGPIARVPEKANGSTTKYPYSSWRVPNSGDIAKAENGS
jgi:cyclopropane-fatty-acyl-phospholipid synthase